MIPRRCISPLPSEDEPWGPVWPENVEKNRCLSPCTVWIPRRDRRGRAGRATSKNDLVTGPIRGSCALHPAPRRISGRMSAHPSGTTRIMVQRSLGTAQGLANPALGSTAGRIARGDGALLPDAPARDLASPRSMGVSLEPGKEGARRRVPNEVALRLLRNLGGIG
jgi:hypothetical protein